MPELPAKRGTNVLSVDSVISVWARSLDARVTQNRHIGTALPLAVMNRIRRQNGGSRAGPATSNCHAARLAFQSASVLITDSGRPEGRADGADSRTHIT